MRAAFSDAIVAAAVNDPKVMLLTGDHGYALFDAFRKTRPNQYLNCGIAEQNMVGVAAGLAKAGYKPIVYGLAAFIPMRVLEQIKIDICYENLPVVLIGDGAGLVYSHLGTSHQCTEDIACTRAIPALTVLSPADRYEMEATMTLALNLRSPVYVRIGKSDRGDIHKGPIELQIGQLVCLTKHAQKIALIATGSMVVTALELVTSGLEAEVWSAPSLKPLNTDVLDEILTRVDYVVTLEEHSVLGGLGASIAEHAANTRPTPVCRIGIQDRFSHSCGTHDYLLAEHRLDLESIQKSINQFMNRIRQYRLSQCSKAE